MTPISEMFKQAARLMESETPPRTACIALAKASGPEADQWAVAQRLFVEYFKPEGKSPLMEWWPMRAERRAERATALWFMAAIAEEQGL